MQLDPGTYERLEREVRSVAVGLLVVVDEDSQQAFTHYLDHGELEMAFEVLCLSAIDAEAKLESARADRLVTIARELGLDTESVFDPTFWQRLVSWCATGGGAAAPQAS